MPIRIVLADDHAVFRSGLRILLEKDSEFRIVGEAGTGTDTLGVLEKQEVDVLVLDISMPGMPSPTVAKRALEKWPNLAIVILTMHEDDFYLREFMRIGVRAFLLKKSTGTEVSKALREAHQGNQYIDPLLAGRIIAAREGHPSSTARGENVRLTPREEEVGRLLVSGNTNAETARDLCISVRTVETHRANIMRKLNLKSRAELVRFALDSGFLS